MDSSADAVASRQRTSVHGVQLDRIDRVGARAVLRTFLMDGRRHQIVTVNVDFIRIADSDTEYRNVLNSADLAVADGMPVVWLSRLTGARLPERIAGIDLVEDICSAAADAGVGVFLLGAGPGVAGEAARALQIRHPRLRIAGTMTPPIAPPSPAGDAAMVDAIQAAGRCVVLVAFGAPRQDRFISENLRTLDMPIGIGVGGSLDILAGRIVRAPSWMHGMGLEWLWRLAQEPGRLWRRYLLGDIPLVAKILAGMLFGRRAAERP